MGDIGLVVTEAELPDGSWRDLVSAFSERPAPPRVVVVTRLADESLWSDVLETGGFDLLPAPSDRKELGRVLELAATEFQAGRRAAAA